PMKGSGKRMRPRPLRVGDKGTFQAHVSGTIGGQPVFAHRPGTIVVQSFTPYSLSARLTATVCSISGMSPQNPCPNKRQVSAIMVKGFAGLHAKKSKFVVVDTPGTKQYRAIKSRNMPFGFSPGGGSPGGAGSGASPGGGSGGTGSVTVGDCVCSCRDLIEVKKAAAKMKGRRPSGAQMAKMRRLSRCMGSCSSVYAGCGKSSKRKRSRRKGRQHKRPPNNLLE
ncbi:MAG: hypothetical protein KJO07_04690, partial [Deltaproteobacteria bacterium]|nr:hypothetical protein [Deltaproteobacteria bacterium]